MRSIMSWLGLTGSDPVVEPPVKVGEYWMKKPNTEDPFYNDEDEFRCEVLEVVNGWVRSYRCGSSNEDKIPDFLRRNKKCDVMPVLPKVGEKWELKTSRKKRKGDPFPPEDPVYSTILDVMDGWVQFTLAKTRPSDGNASRERIVEFINFRYKVKDKTKNLG